MHGEGDGMGKLSDRLDRVDKAVDLYNAALEADNEQLRNEILWLRNHFGDVELLRTRFLELYKASISNALARVLYYEQIKEYSVEHLQKMAEYRANVLFMRMQTNKARRIDNSMIKPIAEIVRLLGD